MALDSAAPRTRSSSVRRTSTSLALTSNELAVRLNRGLRECTSPASRGYGAFGGRGLRRWLWCKQRMRSIPAVKLAEWQS